MDIRLLARESLAFLIAGFAVLLLLALYSFSPQDPSLNHETQNAAVNLTGLVGAYVSDFLYQLFGYAAWLWLALILALVVRIAMGRQPYLGGWTSLFWLPVVLGSAALLQAYVPVFAPSGTIRLPAGPGGALGTMLEQALAAPLHRIGRDVLLTAVILSSLVAASRLSLMRLVRKLYGWLLMLLKCLAVLLARLFSMVTVRKERIEGREVREEIKKQRPEHIARSEPEVGKQASVKVSGRARKEQQTELAFVQRSASGFKLPSIYLFSKNPTRQASHNPETLQAMARMLEKKLLDYRVEGKVLSIQPGPVVTSSSLSRRPVRR